MREIKDFLFKPKYCIQIGIFTNLALTGFKFIAGIVGLSRAMVADALHSLSDIFTSGIVFVGIAIGERPADENHPYGHGNAETIAASIVSLIIIGIGVYAAVFSTLAIARREFQPPLTIALWAAIISILVKELLFRYTIRVGKMSNSPAVIADAWHHRSDAYSSVAALIGIAGARISFLFLDPLAGLVVSGFIIQIGARLIRSNIGIIMDEKPHSVFISNIESIAREIAGVKKIDKVMVHRRGSTYTIDLEIAVDRQISVDESHKIANEVRSRLFDRLKNIREVMVHVNPF